MSGPHNPDQNISMNPTSEDTVILGERGREIPEDIRKAAREFLAVEYDSSAVEGPYPTYADLARHGKGSFTMCSIRAIEKAVLAERERCLSKVTRPNPSDWKIPAFDEQELLEWICERIESGEA